MNEVNTPVIAMTVDLEAQPGDYVWVFRKNAVRQCKVTGISIEISEEKTDIRYKLDGVANSVPAEECAMDRRTMEVRLFERFADLNNEQ